MKGRRSAQQSSHLAPSLFESISGATANVFFWTLLGMSAARALVAKRAAMPVKACRFMGAPFQVTLVGHPSDEWPSF
jgi:hypothetical protein